MDGTRWGPPEAEGVAEGQGHTCQVALSLPPSLLGSTRRARGQRTWLSMPGPHVDLLVVFPLYHLTGSAVAFDRGTSSCPFWRRWLLPCLPGTKSLSRT